MYLRIFRTIIMMLFLLSIVEKGYAGDLVYRLTHNDQYALVLGVVNGVEQNRLVFNVSNVLAGEKVGKEIKINLNKFLLKEFAYKKGDKLLISLDKAGSSYKEKWGIFTVDSLNYANLKISKQGYSMGEKDDAALQWYINSGSMEKEFYFSSNKVFVVRDKKRLQIYPETNQSRQVRREFALLNLKQEKRKRILFTVLGLVIVAAGIFYVSDKKKKKILYKRRAAKLRV